MLPSVASTSLAICLPRLGGTTSGGVFVDVTSVSVAIRSAAGVARCARGHTSIRFVAVSGVASVVKDKFRGVFAIGEIWPKQEDRLAFVFVLGRLSPLVAPRPPTRPPVPGRHEVLLCRCTQLFGECTTKWFDLIWAVRRDDFDLQI